MFLSIFKNVLLILILILILHFLIKNKLSDTSTASKKQLIIKESLRGSYYKKPLYVNKSDSMIESSTELIDVTETEKDILYGITDSGSGLISEDIMKKELLKSKSDEDNLTPEILEKYGEYELAENENCNLPCKDYIKENNVEKKEGHMKALYDFVFSEEKGVEGLNKYFPKNIIDQTKSDKTEIDKHYENVDIKSEENSNYKYEVIGEIKDENIDGIEGIDSMGLSNFSNL